MSKYQQLDEEQTQIEIFKIKRLIKRLDECKGAHTSMVTIVTPPTKSLNETTKLLADEIGSSMSIKDKTNKQSVNDAITYALNKIKLYKNTPPTGLVIFSGKVLERDGKSEEKIVIDLVPYKPIGISLYSCENKFQTHVLRPLLDSDQAYGFAVMDGHGALFAQIQGDSKEILKQFDVDLPKKHHKGGQSSVRFARLRVEKRAAYVSKLAETLVSCFIKDNIVSVQGIILAGCADFKLQLKNYQLLDQRIAAKIISLVDTSYGGENGLNQAIELSQELLTSIKFVQEKNLLSKFFENIATDSGMVIYGPKDTMKFIESGVIEKLIVSETFDYQRVKLRSKVEPYTESYTIVKPEEINKKDTFAENNVEMEILDHEPLVDWLAENYKQYGCSLHFVTNKTPEGFQFLKGFSGIGGFLRYKVDIDYFNDQQKEEFQLKDDEFI